MILAFELAVTTLPMSTREGADEFLEKYKALASSQMDNLTQTNHRLLSEDGARGAETANVQEALDQTKAELEQMWETWLFL